MPPKGSPRKRAAATKKSSQPTRKKAVVRKVPISRETISDSGSEDGDMSDDFIVEDDEDQEETDYDDAEDDEDRNSEDGSEEELTTPQKFKKRSKKQATSPPVTPSPSKSKGKKRTAAMSVSSDSDGHYLSPTQETPKTPKRPRMAQHTNKQDLPSSSPAKNVRRQAVFDQAVATTKTALVKSPAKSSVKPPASPVKAGRMLDKGKDKTKTPIRPMNIKKKASVEESTEEEEDKGTEGDDEDEEDEDEDEDEDAQEQGDDDDDNENDDDKEEDDDDNKEKSTPKKKVPTVKKSSTVYLEDLSYPVIPKLKQCGVFDKDFVDPALKGTYDKLAKLPGGLAMIPWSKDPASSEVCYMMFSTIKLYFPKANMSEFKKLLCFQANKTISFANLSRIDPDLLYWAQPNPLYNKFISFRGSARPAHLMMMGFLHEDKTQETYEVNNGKHHMKSLSIVPFSLEIDRAVSVLCLLASEPSFKAQAVNNTVSFSSRMETLTAAPAPVSKNKITPILAKASATVGKRPASKNVYLTSHAATDDIPIFDARKKKLTPGIFKNAADVLPRYEGTVPMDSLMFVCYTNTSYEKNKGSPLREFIVTHNLLWAAVLAGSDPLLFQFKSLFHDDDLFLMMADRVQPHA